MGVWGVCYFYANFEVLGCLVWLLIIDAFWGCMCCDYVARDSDGLYIEGFALLLWIVCVFAVGLFLYDGKIVCRFAWVLHSCCSFCELAAGVAGEIVYLWWFLVYRLFVL